MKKNFQIFSKVFLTYEKSHTKLPISQNQKMFWEMTIGFVTKVLFKVFMVVK